MQLYDRARACPKCGRHATVDDYKSPYFDNEEYILRTCANCGYKRKEAPLDSGGGDESE